MKFSIFVRSEPYTHPGSLTALNFANAILSESNDNIIIQVFFYLKGVQHSNNYINTPAGTLNLLTAWCDLSIKNNFPLHVCSTSASKYGILKDKNLSNKFTLSGLGQLSSLILSSERVVEF